jgi:peptidyl-tRNA hydrolase, PTH1 family
MSTRFPEIPHPIKAIIGLGNPGPRYYRNRHSVGFRILDEFAHRHNITWQTGNDMELAHYRVNGHAIMLVKPQTYMNTSGHVMSALTKRGIKPEEMLVVHDELELPFGKLSFKFGGSARGHNGLRSIIGVVGDRFARLRVGIGRPEAREDVPDYVLQDFTESQAEVTGLLLRAAEMLDNLFENKDQ